MKINFVLRNAKSSIPAMMMYCFGATPIKAFASCNARFPRSERLFLFVTAFARTFGVPLFLMSSSFFLQVSPSSSWWSGFPSSLHVCFFELGNVWRDWKTLLRKSACWDSMSWVWCWLGNGTWSWRFRYSRLLCGLGWSWREPFILKLDDDLYSKYCRWLFPDYSFSNWCLARY